MAYNKNTSGRPSQSAEIDKLKTEILDVKKQNEAISKQFGEVSQQFNDVMSVLKGMVGGNMSTSPVNTEPKNEKKYSYSNVDSSLEQPSSDDLIRITSICHGELNLVVDGRTVLKFEKYGDTKPVLYSTLVGIVNQNRSFAEEGKFYINSDGAVYYLGLYDAYQHIYPLDVISDIYSYSDEDIKEILKLMCNEQKATLVTNIARDIYNNKTLNHNKVNLVSKCVDVDIYSIANEIKTTMENVG